MARDRSSLGGTALGSSADGTTGSCCVLKLAPLCTLVLLFHPVDDRSRSWRRREDMERLAAELGGFWLGWRNRLTGTSTASMPLPIAIAAGIELSLIHI